MKAENLLKSPLHFLAIYVKPDNYMCLGAHVQTCYRAAESVGLLRCREKWLYFYNKAFQAFPISLKSTVVASHRDIEIGNWKSKLALGFSHSVVWSIQQAFFSFQAEKYIRYNACTQCTGLWNVCTIFYFVSHSYLWGRYGNKNKNGAAKNQTGLWGPAQKKGARFYDKIPRRKNNSRAQSLDVW